MYEHIVQDFNVETPKGVLNPSSGCTSVRNKKDMDKEKFYSIIAIGIVLSAIMRPVEMFVLAMGIVWGYRIFYW